MSKRTRNDFYTFCDNIDAQLKGTSDLLLYGTVPTMGDEGEMVGDSDGDEGSTCSLVKTRQSDRWRHLLAIFSNEQGIIVRGGGVLYICLVCCKISQ